MQNLSNLALTVVVLAIAITGAALALKYIRREQRARNQVEKAVMFFLVSSSAIYLSEYAVPPLRAIIAKPLLEILAGIPTVVCGFFANLTIHSRCFKTQR